MPKRTFFFVMVFALMAAFGGFSNSPMMTSHAQDRAPIDSDSDGIPDDGDSCPQAAGPRDNRGCPQRASTEPVDADGDGIPDESDSCPREAGPADNRGCPVQEPTPEPIPSDRDGDGIIDEADRCPDEAGTTASNGCPDLTPEPTREVTPEREPEILLDAMPRDGQCVVSTAGTQNVNVRALPSIDADIIDVIVPNELRDVYGITFPGPWLYISPAGWVHMDVIRMGGDCMSINSDDKPTFVPSNLPDLDLGLVQLDPETGVGIGDGLHIKNNQIIIDPTHIIAEMPSQPFPPEQLPNEILYCTYENNCIIEGVHIVGQMGLDILFCFDEEGLDCVVLEATSAATANNGDLDILWCPETDPSTPAGEPGLPATECVEISLSNMPQIPTPANQILCPQDENGESGPCVQLDLPDAMTSNTPNDYLWCDLNDPDDLRCWMNGRLLKVAYPSMVVCTPNADDLICDYLPQPDESETSADLPPLMTCTTSIDDAGNTVVECSMVEIEAELCTTSVDADGMIVVTCEGDIHVSVNPLLGEMPTDILINPDIVNVEAETTRE